MSKLTPSMEMYLKTVLRLSAYGKPVRVKDIADSLGVKAPSVSEALNNLKSKGLVLHPSYGEVKLSARGRRVAEGVNERFEVLQRFLVEVLQVDEKIADHEACEIEHVVGQGTFDRLTMFLDFLENCDQNITEVVGHFHEYLAWRLKGERCPVCEAGTEADKATAS